MPHGLQRPSASVTAFSGAIKICAEAQNSPLVALRHYRFHYGWQVVPVRQTSGAGWSRLCGQWFVITNSDVDHTAAKKWARRRNKRRNKRRKFNPFSVL